MEKLMTVIVLSFLSCATSVACERDTVIASDSTGRIRGKHAATYRLTTRLHSMGFFNLSGRICSPNPAVDINALYEKRGYGASVLIAKDFYDIHSPNNFTFAIFYKRIALTPAFTLTPHLGVVMEGFGGSVGDRLVLISSCRLSKHFTIDETTLLANAFGKDKEWLNRLRLIYSSNEHLQFMLSNWHNNAVFDDNSYVSASLQASYNKIKVSNHAYLQTAVSFFVMANNSEEVPTAEQNGIVFTLGVNVN